MGRLPHNSALVIDKAERTGCAGVTVSAPTLVRIVSAKLRNPLASQRLIAKLTGHDPSTVAIALTTPWAKAQMANQEDELQVLKREAAKDVGDSLTYLGSSVRRGIGEVEKDRPLPHILTNAREAASMYARQILPDTVCVRSELKGPEDFKELEELEQSDEYRAFLRLLSDAQSNVDRG